MLFITCTKQEQAYQPCTYLIVCSMCSHFKWLFHIFILPISKPCGHRKLFLKEGWLATLMRSMVLAWLSPDDSQARSWQGAPWMSISHILLMWEKETGSTALWANTFTIGLPYHQLSRRNKSSGLVGWYLPLSDLFSHSGASASEKSC